ncbi:MAG: transposase [Thermoprotei archaeon]|nr:MAG: transposase [Thermoprotei archaeon]
MVKRGRKVKKYYHVKRLIPVIPKSREFKRNLRNELDWCYAAHYVDSAIKTAYSILNSWRRNYLKGRRKRNKPRIKRKFARIKETLYVFRDEKIRITVKPREMYLEFDLSKTWFKKRVKGWDLGELILKENKLILTFRKPLEKERVTEYIGWDLNKYSLDGFSPKYGWIRVDLKKLYHIHRVHEIKRKKAQSRASKKPSLKPVVSKHGLRERNRARDFVHKLTTHLVRVFPKAIHGFEDLDKQGMYKMSKRHNRDIAKQNWKMIIHFMMYKAHKMRLVDPRNTSSICPRCGEKLIKLRKGQVVKCKKCGLTLDRQFCGAINIYLRMCGFPPSSSVFYHVVIKKMIPKWKTQMKGGRGVTTNGDKTDDMLSMNPERADVDATQGVPTYPKPLSY